MLLWVGVGNAVPLENWAHQLGTCYSVQRLLRNALLHCMHNEACWCISLHWVTKWLVDVLGHAKGLFYHNVLVTTYTGPVSFMHHVAICSTLYFTRECLPASIFWSNIRTYSTLGKVSGSVLVRDCQLKCLQLRWFHFVCDSVTLVQVNFCTLSHYSSTQASDRTACKCTYYTCVVTVSFVWEALAQFENEAKRVLFQTPRIHMMCSQFEVCIWSGSEAVAGSNAESCKYLVWGEQTVNGICAYEAHVLEEVSPVEQG